MAIGITIIFEWPSIKLNNGRLFSFSVLDIYRTEQNLIFNSFVISFFFFFLATSLKTKSPSPENPRICGEYLTLGRWECKELLFSLIIRVFS